MRGVITERDWNVVDKNFPGVHRFYLHLIRKPRTFLELLEQCHSFDDTGRFARAGKARRSLKSGGDTALPPTPPICKRKN